MVEGAALEMLYRGNSIEGSNPSLSAFTGPRAGFFMGCCRPTPDPTARPRQGAPSDRDSSGTGPHPPEASLKRSQAQRQGIRRRG